MRTFLVIFIVGFIIAVISMTAVQRTMAWKQGVLLGAVGIAAACLLLFEPHNGYALQAVFILLAIMWTILGRHMSKRMRLLQEERLHKDP